VLLPGGGGGVLPYFGLGGALRKRFDLYGIRAAGLAPGEEPEDRVETMAGSALETIDAAGVVPELVFGWSLGGVIGWELCVRLAERGVRPDLVLVDSSPVPPPDTRETADTNAWLLGRLTATLGSDAATAELVTRTFAAQLEAIGRYRASVPYKGRVLLLTCAGPEPAPTVAQWRTLAPDLTVGHLAAGHYAVFDPGNLPALVDALTPFVSGGMQ
jgi:thioesterase domain-containing protein